MSNPTMSFDDDLPAELDFSTLQRDRERERQFRLRALQRIQQDEMRMGRLKEQPAEAAKLLRLALQDAPHEPRILTLAAQAVLAARGNFAGIGLSQDELLALLQAVTEQLPEAA